MKTNWVVRPPVPDDVVGSLGFPPLQSQLLYNRGITSREAADAFITPTTAQTNDPLLLPDMDRAVARIRQAIADGELIAIFGDFDIDGISGTAVVLTGLKKLGAKVVPYLPDRVDEGHGLNEDAVRALAARGVSLLITVDCGATSDGEINLADSLNVDSIITDHHTVFDPAPYPALALVNPKRPDSDYPFDHLTGVGLAYKLVQAVYRDSGVEEPEELLELVALGTVGDVGPLIGENRYFVSEGLERINRSPLPGLRALVEVSGASGKQLDTMSLSFGLIPRLNAPGRLDDAGISLELLTTTDTEKARSMAALMEQYNSQRQALTAEGVRQAETQIEKRWRGTLPGILMVGRRDWKPGILGLIAARLAESYDRPAIAVAVGEEDSRASVRSVKDFDILEVLDKRSGLFTKFGGHQQAAGFSIPNDNLRPLADFLESTSEGLFTNGKGEAPIDIDLTANPSLVETDLFDFTRQLAPFGEASPQPRFASGPLRVIDSRSVGSGRHLKMRLDDGGSTWDAIAFRQGEKISQVQRDTLIDVAYSMDLNTWQGRTTLQLVVDDLSPASP